MSNRDAIRAYPTTVGGRDYVTLTAPGEIWVPPTADTTLTLTEVRAFAPSEEATWDAVDRWVRTDHHERLVALVASVRTHGIRTPIEIDPTARRVLRGHHRVIAAGDANIDQLPVLWGWRDERWEWDHRDDQHRPYLYDRCDFDDLDS